MTDLRTGIGEWLSYLEPALSVAKKYVWTGPDVEQFWEFIRRAAVVRQYEALDTILKMVDASHGHFGVTLLRPAYEEFIWIKYLNNHLEQAQILMALLPLHGADTSIEAQGEYAGSKEMTRIGFPHQMVTAHAARRRALERKIRAIGRELSWPQNANPLPSMAYLSRTVGHEREYKFLYHATSRFVHFSTHELARRVWGKKGDVHIESNSFSEYWSNFAMYWAFWLFIHLVVEVHDALGDPESTPERDREMENWLHSFEPIPIITPTELESWSDPALRD
jgi:Family of unknown function (DUF5677)